MTSKIQHTIMDCFIVSIILTIFGSPFIYTKLYTDFEIMGIIIGGSIHLLGLYILYHYTTKEYPFEIPTTSTTPSTTQQYSTTPSTTQHVSTTKHNSNIKFHDFDCEYCNGTGTSVSPSRETDYGFTNTQFNDCIMCNGKGSIKTPIQITDTCSKCNGKGKIIKEITDTQYNSNYTQRWNVTTTEESTCDNCNGLGFFYKSLQFIYCTHCWNGKITQWIKQPDGSEIAQSETCTVCNGYGKVLNSSTFTNMSLNDEQQHINNYNNSTIQSLSIVHKSV